MAIMKCPRCGGSGSIWNYQEGTASAGYMSTCPTCGGVGYVTDAPGNITVDFGAYCPHCHKPLKIGIK